MCVPDARLEIVASMRSVVVFARPVSTTEAEDLAGDTGAETPRTAGIAFFRSWNVGSSGLR
jgi:hypothetical protein